VDLRRTWTALLACGAAALAMAPANASAKPGYFVFAGTHVAELNLKGSHGYRIRIGKQGRRAYLLAARGSSLAAYAPRSLAPEGDRIEARFPGLGRVSVRFRPQGSPDKSKPPLFPGCKGGERVEQRGYFVGTIRFRGERGYTSVQTTRARGGTTTTSKEVCKRSIFDDGPDSAEDRTELLAYSRSNGRVVAFSGSAIANVSASTTFTAAVSERRRGMTTSRFTFVDGEESDLAIGDTRPFPLSATVTPPPPFSGSAEYQRTPDGDRTWTGSLAVPLPGLGRVDLAGPDFSALLCQHSGCRGDAVDGHRLPLLSEAQQFHGRARLFD